VDPSLQSLHELADLLQRLNLLAAGICEAPDEEVAPGFFLIAPPHYHGHFAISRWQIN